MYNRELARERLKRFIADEGIKPRQFADRLGYSTHYIHMLCNGERRMTRNVAERTEEVYSDSGISADYLLGAETEFSASLQKEIYRETTRILYEASRSLENLMIKVKSEYEQFLRTKGGQPEDMREE